MTAYYNEHDPFAAAWLRELIAEGLIAPGDVDERSIEDVTPNEIRSYTQCHFFAGIGGWSYALRLAGWPDDRPVWTGSCPCQPFSAAGKGGGHADERHLWPAWFHLITQCRPDVIFGEQVEAAVRHGWLDLVQDDLEGEGYAVGAIALPACSVGAPHIRQRLWFVADAGCQRRQQIAGGALGDERQNGGRAKGNHELAGYGENDMADALPAGRPERGSESGRGHTAGGGESDGMGDAGGEGLERLAGDEREGSQPRRIGAQPPGSITASSWTDIQWLPCRDGKARPTQPGIFPLAHGIPNRVGTLRGAGNAIVPQVAAEVIKAYMLHI